MTDLKAALRELVIANRVLAHEGVLDGFGHVSIRHPDDAGRYFMACSRSPELVMLDDLIEFRLDGEPIDARGRAMYVERAIHGAVYEARPDAMAVCHNHAPSVIPFSVTGARLRPLIHVAGLIGAEIPVWDIAAESGDTDLLVRTLEQGRSLARALGQRRVALMRGHGSVVAGATLPEAVMASIYLEFNGRLQLGAQQLGEIRFLSAREAALCTETMLSPVAVNRAWQYWRARAGFSGI